MSLGTTLLLLTLIGLPFAVRSARGQTPPELGFEPSAPQVLNGNGGGSCPLHSAAVPMKPATGVLLLSPVAVIFSDLPDE